MSNPLGQTAGQAISTVGGIGGIGGIVEGLRAYVRSPVGLFLVIVMIIGIGYGTWVKYFKS